MADGILTEIAPDLTCVFPRSPYELLGDYVILARTIDKCRAALHGTAGEYHWDCGLSMRFFDFKGISPDDFANFVKTGADDSAILAWVDAHGVTRNRDEILVWGYECRTARPDTPEKKAYFEAVARSLPVSSYWRVHTWFDLLDAEEDRL